MLVHISILIFLRQHSIIEFKQSSAIAGRVFQTGFGQSKREKTNNGKVKLYVYDLAKYLSIVINTIVLTFLTIFTNFIEFSSKNVVFCYFTE